MAEGAGRSYKCSQTALNVKFLYNSDRYVSIWVILGCFLVNDRIISGGGV